MNDDLNFIWNAHGVCINPLVYSFDQGKKQCRIRIAQYDYLWFRGHECLSGSDGISSPVSRIDNQTYSNATDAVMGGLRQAIDFFKNEPDTSKFVAYLKTQRRNLLECGPLPEPTQESNMTAEPLIDADTGENLPQEETGSTNPTTSMAVVARATAISPQDAEAAKRISHAYKKAISGLRDVVFCGVEMLEEKANTKHGQFLPWLAEHCPEIPVRTAQQFMACAEAALCLAFKSKSYSQIRNDCVFDNMPISRILQLPFSELPPAAAKAQKQIFELVDGKTQKQLLFDFRDSEPPKRKYNPPVHTKAQIEQIKNAAANELVKSLAQQLMLVDNQTLARCSDESLKTLKSACAYVSGRIPNVKA